MKKYVKYVKYVLGLAAAVFMLFSLEATAMAAEAAAPFTADFLINAANIQATTVTSAREVISEYIQMTDNSSGTTVTANLTVDTQHNRIASHSVTAMNISTTGYSVAESQESYSTVVNGIQTTYTYNAATGKWAPSFAALTPGQLAAQANPFALTGVEATGLPVTTDGQVFKFTGFVNAANMAQFVESLSTAGVVVTTATFPVEVVIDAATLLPKTMTIHLNGLAVADMPNVATSAVAVVNFSEYNMHNSVAVPTAVLANVG